MGEEGRLFWRGTATPKEHNALCILARQLATRPAFGWLGETRRLATTFGRHRPSSIS